MPPHPCPKDPARVDENGRVFAGSQRWIQYYVNYGLESKIEWVSQTQGDGAGYDIRSFDEAGNEIVIEVKTTTPRGSGRDSRIQSPAKR